MKKLIPFLLALLASSVIWAAPQARQRPVGQAASQAPETRATIEGTVSRADSGQPLKGARVTLQASNRGQGQAPLIAGLAGPDGRVLASLAAAVATVTTDGNGRFTFTGVNPGQYQISADRDGFIRSQYGQRTPTANGAIVPVSANQHLTIDLKMLQASVVSGRIITAEGEPAAQATVQAYTYQYSNGQRTLAEVKNVQTNDLGEYRLFWLAPGEYFVSVSNSSAEDDSPVGVTDVSQGRAARGAVGALRVLTAITDRGGPLVQALGGSTTPPIFYPGTIDPDGAIPITVPASVEVRGMDFQLRPMRTATVSGRVVAPFPLSQNNNNALRGARGVNGAEAAPLLRVANAPVQLSLNRVGNSKTGLAGLLNLRLGSTPVNADGSFEIKGVAPGEYNLAATARDANGQQYTSRTRISVGTSDVANLTASVRPGVELRGKIILDGTPPQQFSMSNLRVSIIAEDSALTGVVDFVGGTGGRGDAIRAFLPAGQSEMAEVAADGSFTLRDVGAMEYRVRVTGLPQGAYILAGRIDTADALNTPFTVDNPGSQLQLQLGFSPGRVAGTISDERGAPASGVQAVLVPDEARRGRSDAYFAATTDGTGQYAFNNVPPGRYKLFGWDDVPPGAYQYPDFIRRYEDRGQPITVNANGAITADTRLISSN